MGGGCSSLGNAPPRPVSSKRMTSSRATPSDNFVPRSIVSSSQAAGVSQSQLCSHNVCSILRRKDWEATEHVLATGEGLDISLTKFLERALYEGCPTRLVSMILDRGANPLDSTRCLSDSILGKAEYEMVQKLLDLGCSPNQESEQDKLKRTPMHFSCQTPTRLEIIDLLIERGGNVNLPVGERQWTPLHYLACANYDTKVLAHLVAKGANINARAADGTTPMAVAAFKRAPVEFFREMLALGADTTLQTRSNKNPLAYLSSKEEPVIRPDDIRLILLDPQIHVLQLRALVMGLSELYGKRSEVRRLNSDILRNVGEFLMGPRSNCSPIADQPDQLFDADEPIPAE